MKRGGTNLKLLKCAWNACFCPVVAYHLLPSNVELKPSVKVPYARGKHRRGYSEFNVKVELAAEGGIFFFFFFLELTNQWITTKILRICGRRFTYTTNY